MTRNDVYNEIDRERNYQDASWGIDGSKRNGIKSEGDGPNHSVGNFIVLMQHYMSVAISEFTLKPGSVSALHNLRKVVAIAVSCFEQHGCPSREVT